MNLKHYKSLYNIIISLRSYNDDEDVKVKLMIINELTKQLLQKVNK